MAHGFPFLVAILDIASRKVLAFRLSNTLTSDFCAAALEEALARIGPPEICTPTKARSSPARRGSMCSSVLAFVSAWMERCVFNHCLLRL
jgi:transposase InsO family protein